MTEEFWASPNAEPKRAYRWTVSFAGLAPFICKKVTKPSFTVTESAHTYLNHKFYYPGRVEWNTCSITLVDSRDPNTGREVLDLIQAAGYTIPDNPDSALSTMSKNKSTQALGEIIINQIDADGNTFESWQLINPWIKDVKFGDLDYESDDLLEVECEIRYDYAILEKLA